jgi:4-hydroxybenzoate polyprenyltransferase
MNGIVLELGRKIKTPEKESEGVLTYTSMLGPKKAVYLWWFVLFITLVLSIMASHYAGYGEMAFIILGTIFVLCALPAISYLSKPNDKAAKWLEITSGIWTISMYFTLGGVPMLQSLLF